MSCQIQTDFSKCQNINLSIPFIFQITTSCNFCALVPIGLIILWAWLITHLRLSLFASVWAPISYITSYLCCYCHCLWFWFDGIRPPVTSETKVHKSYILVLGLKMSFSIWISLPIQTTHQVRGWNDNFFSEIWGQFLLASNI